MKSKSILQNKKMNLPSNNQDNLSLQEKKLYNAAVEIAQNDPNELGFVCRSMVSASMPHSKVKGLQYARKNNNFTLTIVGNEEAGGIPYGTYPRLILSWLIGEVVKTKSREILLGQSLSEFMQKLGLLVTGGRWGTISRFKQQLKRLFSSHISFTYEDKKAGKWIHANMNIAEKAQIFWDPNKPDQIDLFKSTVLTGESFYEEVLAAPIPVDIRAINALKDSSLALDIYFWLTYRLGYLKFPMNLSFDKLQLQFGGGYKNTAQGRYEFKRKFIVQIKKVLTIYPTAKVDIKTEGLKISPGISHITKKHSRLT